MSSHVQSPQRLFIIGKQPQNVFESFGRLAGSIGAYDCVNYLSSRIAKTIESC
nr:MAG TPA: hypothetical protein [Caudoviricetes sp.]